MFGDFDEAAYLRANPDVRGLVERGVFRSGFEHWHAVGAKEHALGDRPSGFFEHDLIYDEAAYLKQNPDVAHAVRTRAVRNGYQHWIRFGRREFAHGTRRGPFKAPNGVFRPFRVPTPSGAVFVARAPENFGRTGKVEVRVGASSRSASDLSAACSGPLRLVDVCGEPVTLRLLVVSSPRELDLGAVPLGTRIVVTVHSDEGPAIATFSDRGVQAFSFPTADDANAFLSTARAACGEDLAPPSVVDFTLEHLTSGPRRLGYEKPLTFRIEGASKTKSGGLAISGWVARSPEEPSGFRAWRPARAEFFDLTRGWSRLSRPDILERFPELGSRRGDQFGFRAEVEFMRPFPLSSRDEILFGLTKNGFSEEWAELDTALLLSEERAP
jgi:hypothetical protein